MPPVDDTETARVPHQASTSVSTIVVDAAGIVCWTYRKGSVVTLSAAKEEVGVVGSLVDRALGITAAGNTRAVKVPLLVDIRPVKSVARQARVLLGSQEVSERWCVSGLALVIKSPISRMIGNATLAWQRPRHPMRLFNSVEAAKEWLMQCPPMGVGGTDETVS
jgi:hypothetical protein